MSSPILGIFFVEVFLLEKRPYLIVFPSELIPSLVKFFKGVGVGGGITAPGKWPTEVEKTEKESKHFSCTGPEEVWWVYMWEDLKLCFSGVTLKWYIKTKWKVITFQEEMKD